MQTRCPHCHSPTEIDEGDTLRDIECPSCGSKFSLVDVEATKSFHGEGTRAVGHFELIDTVGIGHFGTVWMARDTQLDRTVALKIPRKDQLDEAQTEVFFREARAAAQLKHPNIVPVHEVGRDDETLYIVSDYVRGANLKEWLSGQRLTSREAADLCVKLAQALHHAHEAGVIHRDLKPGNIMMDLEGEPHIMDFGLAKREAGEITVTMEGQMLGTPAYMSPEQARGEGHFADRRCDVYALGVILYELLTGELPFRGETRMLIVQILRDEPTSPRKLNNRIPRDLETVCLKAMAKEPTRRYQTAQAVAEELTRWLNGEAIHSRPISRFERIWRWSKRNRLAASLMAIAGLLLLVVQVVGVLFYLREVEHRQVAESVADLQSTARLASNDARSSAELAARSIQLRLSENHLNQAFEVYSRGDVSTGLLLLAKSLTTLPKNVPEIETLVRRLIPVWSNELSFKSELVLDATNEVNGIAISPDGLYLAAICVDGRVRVWNLETLEIRELADQSGPNGEISDGWRLAFSPNGRQLAVAYDRGRSGENGLMRVWDTQSWSLKYPPLDPGWYRSFSVAYSPDGSLLMAGSGWETCLWDSESGRKIRGPIRRNGWVSDIDFAPDGKHALIADFSGASLVDVTTGLRTRRFFPAQFPVEAVAFHPDGTRIAVAGQDGTVHLWNLVTEKETPISIGSNSAINDLAFSPNGEYLLCASDGGTFHMLDGKTGQAHATHPRQGDKVQGVCFTPDGRRFASVAGHRIFVWSLRKPKDEPRLLPHEGTIHGLRFIEGSERLMTCPSKLSASGSTDVTLSTWDTRSGELAQQRTGSWPSASVEAFSHDCSRVLLLFDGNQLALVDTKTLEFVSTPLTIPSGVRFLALHPDNDRVVASTGSVARLFSFSAGDQLGGDLEHPNAVRGLDFSADGLTFVSGCHDGQCRVWDALTAELAGEPIRCTPGAMNGISCSPRDGQFIAFGNQTASVWETRTGKRLAGPFPYGPDNRDSKYWDACFSPDGSVAAITSGRWEATKPGEAALTLWDLASGRLIARPIAHPHHILDVAFDPSSGIVATACYDGNVRLYDIQPMGGDPEEITQWAQSLVGRTLDSKGASRFLSDTEVRELQSGSVQAEKKRSVPQVATLSSSIPETQLSNRVPSAKNEHDVLLVAQLASSGDDFDTAKELLDRELNAARLSQPPDRQRQIDILATMANVERHHNRYEAASGHYDEAFQLAESRLGEDHALVVDLLGRWSLMEAHARQQPGRAVELLKKWLDRALAKYGKFGAAAIWDFRTLGALQHELGDYQGAADSYVESATLRNYLYGRKFGTDDGFVAYSYHQAGRALVESGDLEQAENLLRQSMENYTKRFGPTHERVLGVVTDLVRVLRKLDRNDEADLLLKGSDR